MTDVVVTLPVRDGEEAIRFGDYLSRFLARFATEAANDDSAFIMVQTQPQAGLDLKVVTFQEGRTAHAFSLGWAQASPRRSALTVAC